MQRKTKLLGVALSVTALSALKAVAADTSGTLYYTTFSGGQNVHKVDYSWAAGSLSLSANTPLASVPGADGLLFLPNGNLAVAGQNFNQVHEVTTGGALVTSIPTLTPSFHLSLSPQGKVLYSSGIPGVPTAITLNGTGGLGAASTAVIPVVGSQTALDTIAWASGGPNVGKSLYSSSSSGGNGVIGTATIAGGPETPTSITTSLAVSVPASHGLVYDPFSDNFISMGDDEISRFSSSGTLLESRSFAEVLADFDQGTVDGLGHIFAADNGGNLFLIDYSGGTLAGATYDVEFLHSSLDDIAPKVGAGSNPNEGVPDGGSTAALMLAGFLGIGWSARRFHPMSVSR